MRSNCPFRKVQKAVTKIRLVRGWSIADGPKKEAEIMNTVSHLNTEASLGCAATQKHRLRDAFLSLRLEASCQQCWHVCERF